MSPAEAKAISGRSESWLRNHSCAWCGQPLWLALRYGCGAIFDRCDPAEKDFGPTGRMRATSPDPSPISKTVVSQSKKTDAVTD